MSSIFADEAVEVDPLIQRARLLVQQTSSLAQTIGSPNRTNKELTPSHDSPERILDLDLEKYYQFQGGAIAGSSFITTYNDIRQHCKQGSIILVNGYECKLKGLGGEWTASCVELQYDYPGETNLNSLICISKANNSKATHRIESIGMQPVSSQSIQDAVKNLASLNLVKSSSSAHSPAREKRGESSVKRSPTKPVLLKYDANLLYSDNSNKDEKIQEELKKTQDRIAEWNRKIEAKIQEDTILQQQTQQRRAARERHYNNSERESKIPRINRMTNGQGDSGRSEKEKIGKKQSEDESRAAAEEARIIANEKKVQALREKTEQRVQLYKERQQREQEEEKNRLLKLEEERRIRADALPERRNRFMTLKQHTESRLQLLAAKEGERYHQSLAEAEKRLNDLARERGRQKPTAEWFHKDDDISRGKSRWKDSHSAPVLPPIHLMEETSNSKQNRPRSDRGSQSTSHDTQAPSMTMPASSRKDNISAKRLFPLNGSMATKPKSSPKRYASADPSSVAQEDLSSCSDDSLSALDADSIHELKENLRYKPLDDGMNMTIISDVTDEDNIDFRDSPSKISRKKKKTSIPVWKRKPIPLPPYIPVPSNPLA